MSDLATELGLNAAAIASNVVSEPEGKSKGSTAPTPEVAPTEAAADNARKDVKIGEVTKLTLSSIPGIKRKVNPQDKKYDFSSLVAPVANDADGFNYDVQRIAKGEGEDDVRFTRSVQTAYTKANADAKEAGRPERFIGRKEYATDGSVVATLVIRVDDTIDSEDDKGE